MVDNRKGGATEETARISLKREDRGADLPNRVVEPSTVREALVNSLVVDAAAMLCKLETSCEQPSESSVVQVARYAVPVLKDSEPLLVGSGVA